MNCELLFYIVAISFQLSGSILLICFFINKCSRKNILKSTYENNIDLDYGEETQTHGRVFRLDVNDIRRKANNSYKNVLAFVFLSLGYVLSIFGNIGTNCKCYVCLAVIACSFFLWVIGTILPFLIAIIVFRKDCSLSVNDKGEIKEIDDSDIDL